MHVSSLKRTSNQRASKGGDFYLEQAFLTLFTTLLSIYHSYMRRIDQGPYPSHRLARAMPPGNFINILRVTKTPEFKGWLETLLQTHQNRKVFVSTGKNFVDKCFLAQVQHQSQHDFHKVVSARRLVRNMQS